MRALAALALALVSACSLLHENRPDDYQRFDGGRDVGPDAGPDAGDDAGIDAGMDAGPDTGVDAGTDAGIDAGPDGGMPDGGCMGRPGYEANHERSCEDGRDNDCDGLADCNDFDCARSLRCCDRTAPARFMDEQFSADLFDWVSLPSRAAPLDRDRLSSWFDDFGGSGVPRALRFVECAPLDLGMTVSANLRAVAQGCSGALSSCPYGALVLTAASDMTSRSLPDELSLRLYADSMGTLELRRAGAVLARASVMRSQVHVDVTFTPTIDDEGAWITAEIVVELMGVVDPVLEQTVRIPREHLNGEALGCTEALGLYVALEGVGRDLVWIDDVAALRYECPNPNNFRPPAMTLANALDADGVGAQGGWVAGGIGAPGISGHLLPMGQQRWNLVYDASELDRGGDILWSVPFSLGHSVTSESWASWTARARGAPIMAPMALQSFREPHVLTFTDADTIRDGLDQVLSFASLLPGGGARFAIRVVRLGPIDGLPAGEHFALVPGGEASADAGATAFEVPGCRSLRDPWLVPRGLEVRDGVFVLYLCELSGEPGVVELRHAVIDGWPPNGVRVRDEPLADAAALGGALRSIDGALWIATSGELAALRVWAVVGEDLRSALAFAEASFDPREADALPTLRPFAANPVLREDDRLLCGAGSRCSIEGVAVSRVPRDAGAARLLLAITRDDTDHVLLPLEQVMPSL